MVDNTKKIAISEKYNAIPRNYTTIEKLPSQLEKITNFNKTEVQSIDLDGDNNPEYVVAGSNYTDSQNAKNYTNYSEIAIFDHNFNKIATLVKAKNQFWQNDGKVTDKFFCSLSDVEYIDIDNDNVMEILIDQNVYEGFGVNVYKYQNGKIDGNIDYEIKALP